MLGLALPGAACGWGKLIVPVFAGDDGKAAITIHIRHG